ncbi:hypothetical protein AB9C59_01580 [Escherichia coli]|uniref:hypothetical protein n=1 Tax=Enterobacteriaceae TaxID=543 RepID=UPI000A39EDE7|nr:MULTISPECIES: hypothetical protein [Enterobacteriaceae]EFE0885701.1 hypothetical protein [Escherichia coli]MCI4858897.1 hypothetical protein [Escherichia coli]OUE59404.1 hypothetical protein AZ012_003685 [Citrobacter amalonaticus]HAX4737034.1 hypothetical protein [Escherichia coli]HBD4738686.1 hypothetical protein [Escherichia coli]
MAMNKISFAYVTVASPGMIASSQSYTPQMLIRNADPNMSYIVIVTTGMLFSANEPYAVDADILFDGNTVIDPAVTSNNQMQVPLFSEPEDGQKVTLAHLEIHGVEFKKSGVYQVKCNLAEDMVKLSNREFVDSLESFFYVCVNKNEVEN